MTELSNEEKDVLGFWIGQPGSRVFIKSLRLTIEGLSEQALTNRPIGSLPEINFLAGQIQTYRVILKMIELIQTRNGTIPP